MKKKYVLYGLVAIPFFYAICICALIIGIDRIIEQVVFKV